MCTSIVEVVPARGAGRSKRGWFSLTHAVVAYDHPQHAQLEEAVTIDFVNSPSETGFKIDNIDPTVALTLLRGADHGTGNEFR